MHLYKKKKKKNAPGSPEGFHLYSLFPSRVDSSQMGKMVSVLCFLVLDIHTMSQYMSAILSPHMYGGHMSSFGLLIY